MSLESIVVWLLVGAFAGWLAGVLVKGHGFGLGGNIVVGIIGAVIGGWALGMIGIGMSGIVGAAIGATIGAVLLLLAIRLVRRSGKSRNIAP